MITITTSAAPAADMPMMMGGTFTFWVVVLVGEPDGTGGVVSLLVLLIKGGQGFGVISRYL